MHCWPVIGSSLCFSECVCVCVRESVFECTSMHVCAMLPVESGCECKREMMLMRKEERERWRDKTYGYIIDACASGKCVCFR